MTRRAAVWALCLALLLAAVAPAPAGIRSPGKYSGVVVFDRWDGCILYSGIYVMYVSEKTKEGLRKHAGKPVQIDAKEVSQPRNPGDGRIGAFEVLGPAPEGPKHVKLLGLELAALMKSKDGEAPVVSMKITNSGKVPVKVFSYHLALTLLTKEAPAARAFTPSDGPSFALITRQSFEIGGDEPRWEGRGVNWAWTIGRKNALPHRFTLEPGGTKRIDITFQLPEGQYDFLCGYGGGVHGWRCLSSNLVAFDVDKDGKARSVTIEGR